MSFRITYFLPRIFNGIYGSQKSERLKRCENQNECGCNICNNDNDGDKQQLKKNLDHQQLFVVDANESEDVYGRSAETLLKCS